MSKSGPPQVSTTTSNNTPPAYVQAAQQNLLNTGQNLAAPFTQDAPAFGVAGFNPDQTAAFDLARYGAQSAYTTPRPIAAPDFSPNLRFAPDATETSAMFAGPSATAAYAPANPATLGTATASLAGPSSQASALLSGPASQATSRDAIAAQTDPNAYKQFLNPYTQDVVDTSNAELRRQHGITQADISAKMASGAAFGGSREGVRAGEADRAFLDKSGSMTAQLMSQGYDKAVAQAMADTQLRQQAGLQNSQLGTSVNLDNARRSDAVNALNSQLGTNVNLNNAQRSDAVNALNAQLGTQTSQFNAGQSNDLSELNAQLATNVNLNNAQRADAVNLANSALGTNTNINNATRTDAANLSEAQRQDTRDQFSATLQNQIPQLNNQLLNDEQRRQMTALQALLGTGGLQQQTAQQSLNLPADWLQRLQQITPTTTGSLSQGQTSTPTQTNVLGAGVGLATALPGLITALGIGSDEREKVDVKKLGKENGIEMAAYRYKGDPKTYPKVVGPASAQQVERARPGSTRKVGGMHVITTDALRKMMGS
jgi:hypothetical protein